MNLSSKASPAGLVLLLLITFVASTAARELQPAQPAPIPLTGPLRWTSEQGSIRVRCTRTGRVSGPCR